MLFRQLWRWYKLGLVVWKATYRLKKIEPENAPDFSTLGAKLLRAGPLRLTKSDL